MLASYRNILLILLIHLSFTLVSQPKKVVIHEDTLGNVINVNESLSILYVGRYKWDMVKASDTTYVRWKKRTEEEYDSLKELSYNNKTLHEWIGKEFTYFEAKNLKGKQYTADELKGKVLAINFWFVGCGPCKIEMHELNELVKEYQTIQDVVFLSISNSNIWKTTKFLSENPFEYDVIINNRQIKKEIEVPGYPTNIIVDKEGNYHYASSGVSIGMVDILRDHIESALH